MKNKMIFTLLFITLSLDAAQKSKELSIGQLEKTVDAGCAADFPPFARATKDGGVCISITDSNTRKRSLSEPIITSNNKINGCVVKQLCAKGLEHAVTRVLIYYYKEKQSCAPDLTAQMVIDSVKKK